MATTVVGESGITNIPGAANNAQIESLARFAVDEYNKKENANLELVRVISAKKQDVAGTNYFITLDAKEGENKKEYEAKVWVKEWLNFKELVEFKPSTNAPHALGSVSV